jgi:hypothetical protein
VAIVRDLMTASRLESLVTASGGAFTRLDDPASLPPADTVDVLLVDWSAREPAWGPQITGWQTSAPTRSPRIILFGPHTDLAAHAAARAASLGPMRARSALFTTLPDLLAR